jgi:nucleoside diphosphate kinase
MAIEQTLVIIKPDGVKKGVAPQIRQRYLDAGLKQVNFNDGVLSDTAAEQLYREHRDKFFFVGLVLAMTSGVIEAYVFKGENAVQLVRALNGATDPSTARRIQLPSATLQASKGVCQPSRFLGRVFKAYSTCAISSSDTILKSVFFGWKSRTSPLVFSLVPRSHE